MPSSRPASPIRRRLLKGAGLGLIFAGSALAWRSYRNGVFAGAGGPAFASWREFPPRQPVGMRPIVQAAVLAANPHNTQPWGFDVTSDYIDVYADHGRALGPIDPFLRELFIGLGCAIENMVIAATAFGLAPQVVVAPGPLAAPPAGERYGLVARILLGLGEVGTPPLLAAIARRHTNRGPYDPGRALPLATVTAWSRLDEDLDAAVVLVTSAAERARLGHVVLSATRAFVADADLVDASHRWLRTDWGAVQAYRDGLTIDGLGLSFPVTTAAMLLPAPSVEQANHAWLEATEQVHLATAAALGAITVADPYDRAQTIAAGRLWQRIHLSATLEGIALQPLNQPVEMVDRERALGRGDTAVRAIANVLDLGGRRPTLIFRAGYPLRAARPSPRRDVEDVILPRRSL
ncbi:MAG: hypothetical protein EXQ96_08720 [Alphaproteobacteria bacterium]|nr:hypothetical protein [Alphaproteobacteria bacterium]